MANPEHLKILKQGIEAWNKWKKGQAGTQPDFVGAPLGGADFEGMDLAGAYLREVDLHQADLRRAIFSNANLHLANLREADIRRGDLVRANVRGADFSRANLSNAKLNDADFRRANLSGADLSGTDCSRADLSRANLHGANLTGADLSRTDLSGADLTEAKLIEANLSRANLTGAVLHGAEAYRARVVGTVFADVDLSKLDGLEAMAHLGPSELSVSALYRSKGRLPVSFLRGCGLSDLQIEAAKLNQPELSNEELTNILYRIHDLRVHQAIQINPLFISYTHVDRSFVDEMEIHLNREGIRFWRDVHHSTAGPLERQIDRAIRLNPTVLLILSKNSVQSDWVQHEARLARRLAIEIKRDVLCPLALDESWKTCHWPARLREQIMEYNVLDFSDWNDEGTFWRMFARLLDGLHLFYKS